jgi:DNA polymerase-4
LRQASVELVRTLLPTAKGIRLLGVTVSNFENPLTDVADELPLFADEAASARRRDTAPVVEATGGR